MHFLCRARWDYRYLSLYVQYGATASSWLVEPGTNIYSAVWHQPAPGQKENWNIKMSKLHLNRTLWKYEQGFCQLTFKHSSAQWYRSANYYKACRGEERNLYLKTLKKLRFWQNKRSLNNKDRRLELGKCIFCFTVSLAGFLSKSNRAEYNPGRVFDWSL